MCACVCKFNMDIMQSSQPANSKAKRLRKPNFSSQEVFRLLEEISHEKVMLMSANNNEITNKKKADVWRRIAEKVSLCGVAVRSVDEIRDKWKNLKGEVIKRQADEKKTGGGPPKKPSAFEDLVVAILGENTSLMTGLSSNVPDLFSTSWQPESYGSQTSGASSVITMPPILHLTPSRPSQSNDADCLQVTTHTPVFGIISTAPHNVTNGAGLNPMEEACVSSCEAEIHVVDPQPIKNQSAVERPSDSSSTLTPKQRRKTLSARRRHDKEPSETDPGPVEERVAFIAYLQSQAELNKACLDIVASKKKNLDLKNKKLELEIDNLEQRKQAGHRI